MDSIELLRLWYTTYIYVSRGIDVNTSGNTEMEYRYIG